MGMSAQLPEHLQQAGSLAPATSIARPQPREGALAKGAIGLLANEWATAALIFVVTRAVALYGGYLGASWVVQVDTFRNKGWFAEMALNWDAAWYVKIVKFGYQWHPSAEGGTNIAFPPLYPMLVDVVSWLLRLFSFGWDWGNGTYGSLIVAGLLISNISFFLALVLLI